MIIGLQTCLKIVFFHSCHCSEENGNVWCGVVWCGVVWCGVVWCGGMNECVGFVCNQVVNKFFKNVHNAYSCNTMMTPLTTD